VTAVDDRGAIGFAEKIIELLDEGRYTATYKYAVLLALIDVCLERTQISGGPPDVVTTRQLADKIVEIYWPHTVPFIERARPMILRQNTTGQAAIVSAIVRFRLRHVADPSVPRWEARRRAPQEYELLVREVEWKLIQMPLPRLQTMGHSQRQFIYQIYWDVNVNSADVARYLKGAAGCFDNRILFNPHVGEYLLQLSGLLRPLIQRRWAAMVAQVNRLEDSQLELFLFGAHRIPTARVRAALWEIQEKRCFYCNAPLREPLRGEVDHFLPWARYPEDSLDNFVIADPRCNNSKSSSLAASRHVVEWARRFEIGGRQYSQLNDVGGKSRWPREPDRTRSVARAIYLRLPADARLWLRGKEFVAPDPELIRSSLT